MPAPGPRRDPRRPAARPGARPDPPQRVRRLAGLRALPHPGPVRGLRRPAGADRAHHAARPAAGAARPPTAWACPECGHRGLRAPVLGDARTAEELGRAFPARPVRTSSGDRVLADVDDEPGDRRGDAGRRAGRRGRLRRRGAARHLAAARRAPTCAPTRRRCAAGRNAAGLVAARRARWSRSATRPTRRSRRWCAGTRPASPPARCSERLEAHLPPASRLATITGEPGAVDDALTLLDAPAGRRGARPGATVGDGSDEPGRWSGCPRAQRRGAVRARWASCSGCGRAASSTAVRIQVDPVEPLRTAIPRLVARSPQR